MSGERLGRRLLRFDAAYCLGAGVIAVGLCVPLARLYDTPSWIPAAAGAPTVAWALLLRTSAARPDWRRVVGAVAGANVLAAAALAGLALVAPGIAGRLLLLAVAVEVAAFGAGQLLTLRR
jgi:uncharacterized membrane protein